jgi:hypothetical protein
MLPQNVAEILIAEMRAVDSTGKMKRSNKPAQIDSRPVVRLPARRKNEPDLAAPISKETPAADLRGPCAEAYFPRRSR